MKYNEYMRGYGPRYQSEWYSQYLEKIDNQLEINDEFDEAETKDIEKVLKLSLENRKSFYENAKPYMQKIMEQYVENVENEILF